MVSMDVTSGINHSSRHCSCVIHCSGWLCGCPNNDVKMRCALRLLRLLTAAELRAIAAFFGQAPLQHCALCGCWTFGRLERQLVRFT